jgi:hypothetical protein
MSKPTATTKMPRCDLDAVVPTEEELKAARSNIGKLNAAQLQSKKASVRHFMKECKLDGKPKRVLSGDERLSILEKFEVHLGRFKETRKEIRSEKSVGTKRRKITDLHWWSREQMVIVLGVNKTNHWIQSKLLPKRPERITRSTEDDYIEHGIPDDWEQLSEEDFRRIKGEIESQMQPEDFEAFDLLLDCRENVADEADGVAGESKAVSACATQAIALKEEREKMAVDVERLKSNLEDVISRMNKINLDSAKIEKNTTIEKAKPENKKKSAGFYDPVLKDAKNSKCKSNRCMLMLKRMNVDEFHDDQIPKMVKLVREVDQEWGKLLEWAIRFKVWEETASKKRKK